MRHRAVFLLPLLLAACGQANSAREVLGLNREAPDEFQVVSRPPLSVPREFNLIPPSDDADLDLGGRTDQQARSLMIGKDVSGDAKSLEHAEQGLAETAVPVVQSGELESPGESAFLKNVGALEADSTIRSKLSQEVNAQAADEPSLLEKLRGEEKVDPVIDAKQEAERIRTNKDQQKPLNEGEVKTVDPKKKSVIDRIFD